ncbi:MAG: tyrosine-protein phosphatase [Pirellulales bacterium]
MAEREPLVDIHCHLLPGLDDGAESWEESLAMARMAVADGISTVVATPHQLGNFGQNDGDMIRGHVRRFQEMLDEREIALRVLPGADVRIESDMIPKLRSGEVLTLADRRRHVLLELPHEVYLPLDRLLSDLERIGLVGILSHPERNAGILSDPSVLSRLVEAGCLLQVTAGSLLGSFGPPVQALAESIIKHGAAHLVATDAHGTKSRVPRLARAFDRVALLAGAETASAVFCRNPARVAAGEAVTPGYRKPDKRGWASWLGWRKAG